MGSEPFGTSSAGPVKRLTLGSAPGPVLELLDLGATVHRLWVTCGDGVRRNVVLGHATPEEYLDSTDYVGGTIGRYANRIRDGRFPLDGRTVQVATNEGDHTLHGGPDGFHRRIWEVADLAERRVRLRLRSPDGDQGFPAALVASACFEVIDDGIRLTLEATSDAPTVVNLTSHTYLNLDGDVGGTVEGHLLTIPAPAYLSVDDHGIPRDLVPVGGTPYDLREWEPLGEVLAATGGLDHSYALPGAGLRPAAVLESPATRTRVTVRTDQPGVHVYPATTFDGTTRSVAGHPHRRAAGVALEAQRFPDTPNRPDLGSALLVPGERYRWRTEWTFGPGGPSRAPDPA